MSKELEKVKARIKEIEMRKATIVKESKVKLEVIDVELKGWKAKAYDLLNQ